LWRLLELLVKASSRKKESHGKQGERAYQKKRSEKLFKSFTTPHKPHLLGLRQI
jgi:hypothetical protein